MQVACDSRQGPFGRAILRPLRGFFSLGPCCPRPSQGRFNWTRPGIHVPGKKARRKQAKFVMEDLQRKLLRCRRRQHTLVGQPSKRPIWAAFPAWPRSGRRGYPTTPGASAASSTALRRPYGLSTRAKGHAGANARNPRGPGAAGAGNQAQRGRITNIGRNLACPN
jgi:hypothetical protein